MSVNLSPVGGVAGQFFDNNGDPLVGGKLFTYAAGTTTPQATFTSSSGSTPNSNPIILNGGGRVPSEIWLTDGSAYKFVLYSSTDQLIGSWDNISGINSNFVNYTASQEIQTATAGQTVFTLTTMQYQPGTNSLTVYVDGVNQYGPSAQYAYVETNSTTVTFTNGLHVGAEVKFTSIQQATSSATDASQVAYQPAGTGAVATNVQAKLRESVSVKDFGAVGDGVTDDTAAIQAAVDALLPGQTLDGLGSTYLVTSSLTLKANITFQNFVIDFSTAGNSAELLVASGSMGTSFPTSGDTPDAGEAELTLTDANSFAEGDYVFLSSTDYWDNWDDIVTYGEVHKIKSATSSTVTFYDPCVYTTTDGAVAKINTLDNLIIRNVRAFGNGAGASGDQEGMRLSYCRNLLIDNCHFTKFDDRCVRLTRCIDFEVRGGHYGIANKTALAYGVALGDCCNNGVIHGATFIDTRHGVSLGDTAGPNRYIIISDNVFTQCREAGVDGHTAADHCVVANNVIQVDPNGGSGAYGILWRSIHVNIANNRITSCNNHGIFVRNNVTGEDGDISIVGNSIIKCGGTGVFIQKQREGNVFRINIANNNIRVDASTSLYGIAVNTSKTDANVFNNVSITGNNIQNGTNSGILVLADGALATVKDVVIANNTIRTVATRGIYVVSDTDGNISEVIVNSNTIAGTITIGLEGLNEENIVVVGNNFRSAGTATSITAANNVVANNLT